MSNKMISVNSSASEARRGTLRSMPTNFVTDINTGAASVSFPLALTQSRALTPDLSLNYHTNQGNSVFGIGFDLSGVVNITRSTSQGGVPRYDDDSDIFILSHAGQLVKVKEIDNIVTYRPRLESQFAIIEYHLEKKSWLIREANGVNHTLGLDESSQVNAKDGRIFQWWVSKTEDAHGNKINYTYSKNKTVFYLDKIQYGNYSEKFAFRCQLDYGENDAEEKNKDGEPLWRQVIGGRSDQFTHHNAGFPILTKHLCRRILLYHTLEGSERLVKYWELHYKVDSAISLLQQIQEIGCRSHSSNLQYITKKMPPAVFNYLSLDAAPIAMKAFELEGDLKFPGLAGTYQWVDLYRDGLPGILYNDELSAWYWRSEGGGKFSAPKQITSFPNDMDVGSPTHCRIMHLGVDKKTAFVIVTDEQANYCLLDEEKFEETSDKYEISFSPQQPLEQFPITLTDPMNEVMDMNGYGKSDLLVLNTMLPYYHPASDIVGAGYEPEKLLNIPTDFPRANLDPNALVTFADMFGDGLLHRVKINKDGIDIWPNLGDGHFSEKIHWDLPENLLHNSDEFDPACVYLVDIDGSGASDFVYVCSSKARAFLNQGQGFFTQPLRLPLPESFTHHDRLLFGDFLGTGVTSVIFIKQDLNENRYYSGCFSPQKPYLLSEITQSSGLKTQLFYDTSMTTYLEDRKNSAYATIRLPFALSVLSKTMVTDPVTHATITKTYQYHHGEYDFSERRFCGFSYVVETRSENIGQTIKPIQDSQIKYWFYNRVISETKKLFLPFDVSMLTAEDIDDQYFKADEKTSGDSLDSISTHVRLNIEAHFALHGHILHQEIWGGSIEAPISVQVNHYNIRCDQLPKDQHGIFVVQLREAYHLSYEQKKDEPRISREINIAFDEKNRVLVHMDLHYGRQSPVEKNLMDDLVLDQATIDKLTPLQSISRALCHEKTYAHSTLSEFQFLHLISEEKTFEILPEFFEINPTQTFLDIKHLPNNANKLVQHYQQYYWDDAQENRANLHESGSKALVHHEKFLLGTTEQIQSWYQPILQVTETIDTLLTSNGYVNEQTQWWQPNAVKHYGDATNYYQLTEITQISDYNMLSNPHLFQRTVFIRDHYELCVLKIEQYLTQSKKSFVTENVMDYHSLQPYQVIDHNHNIQLMLRDPLGMVIAITQYGQLEGRWIGNPAVNNPEISLTEIQLNDMAFAQCQQFENVSLENIIENSKEFLGKWLHVYHHYYQLDQHPRCTIELTQHHYQNQAMPILTDIPPTQISLSIYYFDSFDHLLQTKLRTDETSNDKRWLCSGVNLHSQSGKLLQQSLPFYSKNFDSELAVNVETSLLNEYDAAFNLIQQTLPNRDQCKILHSPWYEVFYDQNVMMNKNNLNSSYNLPATTVIHFSDGAGNIVGNLKIASEITPDRYVLFRSQFDILSRPISHQDARLTQPNLNIVYNLLGQVVFHDSVDQGKETYFHNHQNTLTRRQLGDWSYDYTLDSWQRVLSTSVYTDQQEPVIIETKKYGEMQDAPENTNACGQIVSFANEEGTLNNLIFNLNGQCIQSNRTIFLPAMNANINQILSGDEATIQSMDWCEENFSVSTEYNALGHLLAERLPDGKLCIRQYNVLSQLQTIQAGADLASLSLVTSERMYQETGQCSHYKLGEKTTTTHCYDTLTQRLIGIKTLANNKVLQDQAYTFDPVGNIVTIISGELQLSINANFTSTLAGHVLNYHYDDYYRLSFARGLEMAKKPIHSNARDVPQSLFSNAPFLAVQLYNQYFTYDIGNNLTHIHHLHADQTDWSLGFDIKNDSNQFSTLTSTVSNTAIPLNDKPLYDAAGNMQKLDAVTDLSWSHTNQLRQVTTKMTDLAETNADNINVKEYYAYRGTAFQDVPFTDHLEKTIAPYSPSFFGQSKASHAKIDTKPFAEYANRLYKISCFEKGNSIEVIEQLFLGAYERKRIFKISNNETTVTLIRHTLCVKDEETILATQHQIELDLDGREAPQPILENNPAFEQWQYHLTDHLHSSLLDIDHQGNVLGFEAYQAYGQIAFIMTQDTKQLSLKDYHYSSQMHDQVSGLYYYGARYYAPQFGRWLSPDPAGLVDGLNVYGFVKNNPVSFFDLYGLNGYAEFFDGTSRPDWSGKVNVTYESYNPTLNASGARGSNVRIAKFLTSNPGVTLERPTQINSIILPVNTKKRKSPPSAGATHTAGSENQKGHFLALSLGGAEVRDAHELGKLIFPQPVSSNIQLNKKNSQSSKMSWRDSEIFLQHMGTKVMELQGSPASVTSALDSMFGHNYRVISRRQVLKMSTQTKETVSSPRVRHYESLIAPPEAVLISYQSIVYESTKSNFVKSVTWDVKVGRWNGAGGYDVGGDTIFSQKFTFDNCKDATLSREKNAVKRNAFNRGLEERERRKVELNRAVKKPCLDDAAGPYKHVVK